MTKTMKTILVAVVGAAAFLGAFERVQGAESIVNGRPLLQDATYATNALPAALTGATNQTINSTAGTPIPVPPNADIAFWWTLQGRGASDTNSATLGFNNSPDSNVWSTTLPTTISATANASTQVVAYAVISKTNLYGVQWLRPDQLKTTNAGGIFGGQLRYRYLTP